MFSETIPTYLKLYPADCILMGYDRGKALFTEPEAPRDHVVLGDEVHDLLEPVGEGGAEGRELPPHFPG